MIEGILKKIYGFLSGFEIPAYYENTVPQNAELPYLIYNVELSDYQNQSNIFVNIYYKDTTLLNISKKIDEIAKKIGYGFSIEVEDGKSIILQKGVPFVQFVSSDEVDIKHAYLIIDLQNNTF